MLPSDEFWTHTHIHVYIWLAFILLLLLLLLLCILRSNQIDHSQINEYKKKKKKKTLVEVKTTEKLFNEFWVPNGSFFPMHLSLQTPHYTLSVCTIYTHTYIMVEPLIYDISLSTNNETHKISKKTNNKKKKKKKKDHYRLYMAVLYDCTCIICMYLYIWLTNLSTPFDCERCIYFLLSFIFHFSFSFLTKYIVTYFVLTAWC